MRASIVALVLSCTLGATACGGLAVIDAAGPGAAGSPSDGGRGGGPTTTPTGTPGGGGSGDTLCEDACDHITSCSIETGCVASCAAASASCRAEQQVWLECGLASPDPGRCDFDPECMGWLGEYYRCEGVTGFGVATCYTPEGGGCACTTTSSHGVYQAICDSAFSCTCLRGVDVPDTVIGSCVDDGMGGCDPVHGCCGVLFFVPGL